MSTQELRPTGGEHREDLEEAAPIGRFRRVAAIGSGGMADVFEAIDDSSGKHVALKLLRLPEGEPEHAKREFRTALFEREYHALSQLAHPRVVEAYEYGISDEGPFYTMELLDGADLMEFAPMPWRRACAVFRDVCAVLSLLHSRRLLYRDLNPRNIRVTSDGIGKLIDFGALMPMGNPRKAVGMPAFVAPEFVNRQLSDGRADLFGVGTTLYYALTGRLAFAARAFEELPLLWRAPPEPPSVLEPEIPAALDALVVDLLRLDRELRPASAGDVIDRLEAIAGLVRDHRVFVARAYLATPVLVEREGPLKRARRRLERARRGKGHAMLAQGEPGAGRTRFLDACVLEAKLSGMHTAVADAGDGQTGPYGVARFLANQLIDAMPEAAEEAARPHAAVLGHVVPELEREGVPLAHFADPRALRPAAQAALRGFFTALASQTPMLLGVDDIDLVDEPSAALLARLSADVGKHALAIVATSAARPVGNPVAMGLLVSVATTQVLAPLSHAGTRRLLASVFGESARLPLLAARVHQVAEGKPRSVMQLAQHLVDARRVRLDGGAWTLPAQLTSEDLPTSATDAMARRVAGLDEHSLALARALALSGLPALDLEGFVGLFPQRDAAAVLRSIGELVEAEVVRMVGGRYSLNGPSWKAVLLADFDPGERACLHGRLAELVERSGGDPLRAIQHLRYAGQDELALDRLIEFSRTSQVATAADPEGFLRLVEGLPAGWYELFDWAVETARERERPPADIYELQGRLAGLLSIADPNMGAEHILELLSTLREAVGLDIYDALPEEIQGMDRLKAALDAAQARFDGLPEGARILPPLSAIRPLAQAVIPTAALTVTTYDYDLLFQVPSLEPLHPLSPALQVVSLLMNGLTERMTGRLEQALAAYKQALEMVDRPDHSGVDPTHAAHMRLGVIWGMGLGEASLGNNGALVYVEPLLADPWHRVSGVLTQMLHAYWQADPEQGDAFKARWVLERIEARSQQWFDGAHLVSEATAHALADDLPRLRDAMKDIEVLAAQAPGWGPAERYARGEYHRIRGDAQEALACFEAACNARGADQHLVWAYAATGQLRALTALGRCEDAVARGRGFLKVAQERGLTHLSLHIRIALARGLSEGGEPQAGAAEVEAVLARLEEKGRAGLLVAWARETRAQIALAQGDLATAEACLVAFRQHLHEDVNPVGRRRCQLLDDRIHGRQTEAEQRALTREQVLLEAELRSAIARCDTLASRAQTALELFTERVGARGGVLRLVDACGDSEVASVGLTDGEERMRAMAEALYTEVAGLTDDDTMVTGTGEGPDEIDTHVRSVVLKHERDGTPVITGVAVLAVDSGASLRLAPEMFAAAVSRSLVGSLDT